MKHLNKFMIGLLLLGASHLGAQNGLTPVQGQNPEEQNSRTAQQQHSTARVVNDVPLNGNGVLGPAYQGSECGLNYVTSTVKLGQRFAPVGVPQPASFPVAGAGPVLVQAFVWCDASGTGAPITLTFTNTTGGTFSVPMSLVGSDVDKCWGYAGSHSYRADVTAAVDPSMLNGTYTISGFPTGSPDDVDGATLMIITKDPGANFQGDLVIWDGALTRLGVGVSTTMTGFQACNGTISNARAFMGLGDLQGLGSQMTLNGTFPVTTTEDWWNYVETPTTVTPGQNTSVFGNSVFSDCYNIAFIGLYWQSDCKTCDYPCEAKPDFEWHGCNPVDFHGWNNGVSPVAGWFWQFGDGSTSTLQNPSHTYALPGVYKVCLTIISVGSHGETCCEQICKEVEACPPPPCSVHADFNWFTTASNPMQVNFTDASVYPIGVICGYTVDYGDGSPVFFGTSMPPFHVYSTPGYYKVCITVKVCVYDAAGNLISVCDDSICKEIYAGQTSISNKVGQKTNTSNDQSVISVFPSPTSNLINVSVPDGKAAVVRVLNSNGQEVAVAKASSKNLFQADVSNLAPGVYFVTVQNADGTIRKQSFVKE